MLILLVKLHKILIPFSSAISIISWHDLIELLKGFSIIIPFGLNLLHFFSSS